MIRTAVVGAGGKMGKTLVSQIAKSTQLELASAVEQPGVYNPVRKINGTHFYIIFICYL